MKAPPPPENEKPGPEIAVSKPSGTPKSSFFPTGKSLDNHHRKSGQTGNHVFSTESRKPLEIELMLSDDQRRPLSVAGHHEFRESLASPDSRFDEIDKLVEQIRQLEPEGIE